MRQSRLTEVRVPDMGNFKDVAVIDVLVKPGDSDRGRHAAGHAGDPRRRRWTCLPPPRACSRSCTPPRAARSIAGDLIATVSGEACDGAGASAAAAAPAPPRAARAGSRAGGRAAAASPRVRRARRRAAAAPPAAAPPAAPPGAVLTPRSRLGMPTSYRGDLARDRRAGILARARQSLGAPVRARARASTSRRSPGTASRAASRTMTSRRSSRARSRRRRRGRARAGGRALPACRRWISRSSARRRSSRCRASSASPVRACTRAGSTSRTSRSSTRRTSPSSSSCARASRTGAQEVGVKLRRSPSSCAPASRRCRSSRASTPRSMPSGANLIVRKYVNIGFAADTPNGLVVPVVRDADRKDMYELARSLGSAVGEGARRQAAADRHAGRLLHHLEPRRHRRHGLHADHQRARGRDPRRVALPPCARCGATARSCRA